MKLAREVYPAGVETSKADVYSPNVTWVQDGIFAAGGDALPRGWEDFAAQTGITAVLHLRPATPAPFLGRPPEAYLWLSVDDERQAGLDERWLAGRFIQACLAEGRRVLMHAARGRHRTRWVYVAYRICAGSTPRAAVRRAGQPPWLAPYSSDRDQWEAFGLEARSRRRGTAGGRSDTLESHRRT